MLRIMINYSISKVVDLIICSKYYNWLDNIDIWIKSYNLTQNTK